MTRIAPALLILALLSACGQGGRPWGNDAPARDGSAPPAEGSDPIVDPVAEPLQPVGLGYRIDTTLGTGDSAIKQSVYGLFGLPVLVDVDGDSGTGNLLGADIRVQFLTLLLFARLQIDVLDAAPEPLPLQVEVTILDPRNLLGLPGLLGIVDPDWRIAMGMDARESSAPAQFSSQLTILDSLFEFLPRLTSAELALGSSEAQASVAATLAMFTERSGGREDGLELRAGFRPAVTDATINVVLAPDAEESSLGLDVSSPTEMEIRVDSYDGPETARTSERLVSVALRPLGSHFDLNLTGVDGLEAVEARDVSYRLSADQAIDEVRLDLLDAAGPGRASRAQALIRPLPAQVEILQPADGGLSISTDQPINDLLFAQADNTPIVWPPGDGPDAPFTEHYLRVTDRDDGIEVLQARLGGLSSLNAQFDPDLDLEAELSAAPLSYRFDEVGGFTQARLERLPGNFSVQFPDDDETLRFIYTADAPGPGLHYERQEPDLTTIASITPLAASFEICAASDGTCDSHGSATKASLAISASEHMLVNYRQRSADGQRETAMTDLFVRDLHVDAGARGGFKEGYVYFDTRGATFSGSVLQRNRDSGLYLSFSEGTFAEERVMRFKNFIETDERSGTMRCPGREQLEILTGGLWYDADFILDQLCQE